MKEDIKDRWVAALRSGKYEQGRLYLQSKDNKFCCLGVLCDIVKNEIDIKIKNDFEYGFTYDGYFGVLPPSVINYTEIKNDSAKYVDSTLAAMNDTYNKTFDEIADIIEKHWKEL